MMAYGKFSDPLDMLVQEAYSGGWLQHSDFWPEDSAELCDFWNVFAFSGSYDQERKFRDLARNAHAALVVQTNIALTCAIESF